MKWSIILLLFLIPGVIGCSNPASTEPANTKEPDTLAAGPAKDMNPPAPPMDSAAMMKKWMESMTPGPMHKLLAACNGTWTGDITMWMNPAKPPVKNTATCENKMIMGGRYQQSVAKGTMNGMPFEGSSITGFDNAKKVFVSIWVDNMGTGIMYMEGPWDSSTRTVMLTGKMADPVTGKDVPVRETLKLIDDKNQLMEMYQPGPDGKEYKSMEIKYTKK